MGMQILCTIITVALLAAEAYVYFAEKF